MSKTFEVTKYQLAQILKVSEFIGAKCKALDDVVGDAFGEFLGWELQRLNDVILDIIEMPPDTTVEEGSEHGFCRDSFLEVIWESENKIDLKSDIDSADNAMFEEQIDEFSKFVEGWEE
jgi:hypothetical protein